MKINQIDDEITRQISLLDKEIEKMEFENVDFEFYISESEKYFKKEALDFQGIYLIEIENKTPNFKKWIKEFSIKWENKKFHNRPRVRKKSVENLTLTDNWIPLYIGKSKKVGNRLFEHLFLENNKSTYALKLSDKKFLKNEKIRIKTIQIEVENYDQIVPHIESKMRDKIKPIVGKQ